MEEPRKWYPSGEVQLTVRGKWPDLAEGLEAAADYIREERHEGLIAVAVRATPPRFTDEKLLLG